MIGLDKLKRGIGITALVLLLWAGLSTAAYFTRVRGADHRDFYPRWAIEQEPSASDKARHKEFREQLL